MPPCKINIAEADIEAARYEKFNNPDPRIQKRMFCLDLKSKGYSNYMIADVLDCHRNTVGNYLKIYAEYGIDGVKTINKVRRTGELEYFKGSIEASFKEKPPRSVKEARARIIELTRIERSLTRVRVFLNRMGFRPRATGQIPAKANPEVQKQFLENLLEPLLEEAKAGERHVFFMDGAHFVLGAFVGIVWCLARVFVKTSPGRFRLNVLGALHATTHELTSIYNTSYVNANTVVELLKDIARDYSDKPVSVILDNVRYQHCKLVKDKAVELGIELVFLPPYSPNLNLIERLWKLVKSEVCAANYFSDKESFENSIIDFLASLRNKEMKNELKSRFALNFQLFDNAQNRAA